MNPKEYFETVGEGLINQQTTINDQLRNEGILKTFWNYRISFLPLILLFMILIFIIF